MAEDTKPKFISIASPTEPGHSRAVPGVPPNPALNLPKLWVAGSSCEALAFALTARDGDDPIINIQGDATNLTGPLNPNFSFTASLDIGTDGSIYAVGGFLLNDGVTWINAVTVFASTANNNATPTRIIGGGTPMTTTLTGNVSGGAVVLPVASISGFVAGAPISVYCTNDARLHRSTVAGAAGSNITINDPLPSGGANNGAAVQACLNLLNYYQQGNDGADAPGLAVAVDASQNVYVGAGGRKIVDLGGGGSLATLTESLLFKFTPDQSGSSASASIITSLGYGEYLNSVFWDEPNQWVWTGGTVINTFAGVIRAFSLDGTKQREITGSNTQLAFVAQVSKAPTGEIVVAQFGSTVFPLAGGAITVFAGNANGNAVPLRSFGDNQSNIYLGAAVDSNSDCFVSNGSLGSISIQIFPFSSSGITMPTASITSSALTIMIGDFDTNPLQVVVR